MYPKWLPKKFGAVEFEAMKTFNNSFVPLFPTSQVLRKLWVGTILLLFRMVTPNSARAIELAFLQYMEYKNPLYSPDDSLPCICLHWSTNDEHNHTPNSQRLKWKKRLPVVSEWFVVKPFSSIRESVGVMRANYGTQRFTEFYRWHEDRSYISRLHWVRSMQKELQYTTNVDDRAYFFL